MMEPVLSPQQARYWFSGALVVAALVRLYLLWQYYCISSDGVIYLQAAKAFLSGDFSSGFGSIYPPGYPLVVAALYPLIGDWELTGQILSLIFGVAILFPLYWLFRELFGQRVALLACYLAGINPFLALYSVHVRTEIMYLFLSTLALYLFLIAIQRRLTGRFFWGGLVAGYAYLARPEAIGFVVIVPGVLLWRWLMQRDGGLMSLGRSVALIAAGFLIFALPYIAYLSIETGRFGALSRKAGVTLAINLKESGMLDDESLSEHGDVGSLVFTDYILQHPQVYINSVLSNLLPAVAVFFAALHYSYVPFLLVGLILAVRAEFWRRPDLLLVAFALFYVFGFALIYVKRRYSLQAVPISLAWVALGMWWVRDKLPVLVPERKAAMVAVVLAVIFIGATLPKTLRPVSREKAYVRETGRYLKARNSSGTLGVAVLDDRITFYADARTIPLTGVEGDKIASYLREKKADYLAAESKAFERVFPAISRTPERFGLVLERNFIGTRKDRMMVFRVQAS